MSEHALFKQYAETWGTMTDQDALVYVRASTPPGCAECSIATDYSIESGIEVVMAYAFVRSWDVTSNSPVDLRTKTIALPTNNLFLPGDASASNS